MNIHGNLQQQLTIFRENFDWSLSLTFDRCRSYRDLLQSLLSFYPGISFSLSAKRNRDVDYFVFNDDNSDYEISARMQQK